jgi:hypothetical protein
MTTALYLRIATGKKQPSLYRVARLDVEPRGVLRVAWRLMTTKGDSYDVTYHRTRGSTCECPDFEFRNHLCKHLLAMKATGLLPKEEPRRG